MTKPEKRKRRQEIIRFLESKKITLSDGVSIHDMVDQELFRFYKKLEL